jgi:hypothetical protein
MRHILFELEVQFENERVFAGSPDFDIDFGGPES